MKLLVRNNVAVGTVPEDYQDPRGGVLVDYPEDMTLDELTPDRVAILVEHGVEGLMDYLTAPKYPQKISLYTFRRRFTLEQRVAIEDARKTDPLVDALMKDLESIKYRMVDLGLQETIDGVGVMVSKGFIIQERADFILHYGDEEPVDPTVAETPEVSP